MPSETFFCPHCHRQLTKSAQAYVMGELMGNQKSNYIGIGSRSETVRCPGCGMEIDTQKMVAGDYDGAGASNPGCLEWIAGMATFAVTVLGFGWAWWVGILCSMVVAGAVISIRDTLKKTHSR